MGQSSSALLMIDPWFGVAGFNATEAYRLAGFKAKGEGASSNAWRVRKDRVQKEIARRMGNRRKQPMAAFQTLLGLGTARPRSNAKKT